MSILKTLTLLVTAIAVGVAYQQWWVNREKLRLDLFDRRLKIFDATRTFIDAISGSNIGFGPAQKTFRVDTRDRSFLFAKDVVDYLDEVNRRAIDLNVQRTMIAQAEGTDCAQHRKIAVTLEVWLLEQLNEDSGLVKMFAPYLRFQDLEDPLSRLGRWRRLRSMKRWP